MTEEAPASGDSAHQERQDSRKTRAASCGGWSPHGHMEQWLGAQPGEATRRDRKPPPCLYSLLTSLAWLGTARRETLASSRTGCQIRP